MVWRRGGGRRVSRRACYSPLDSGSRYYPHKTPGTSPNARVSPSIETCCDLPTSGDGHVMLHALQIPPSLGIATSGARRSSTTPPCIGDTLGSRHAASRWVCSGSACTRVAASALRHCARWRLSRTVAIRRVVTFGHCRNCCGHFAIAEATTQGRTAWTQHVDRGGDSLTSVSLHAHARMAARELGMDSGQRGGALSRFVTSPVAFFDGQATWRLTHGTARATPH